MMRLGDADLRIRPAGLLAAVHEGDHPRQVGLVGQHLQVVEQLHVRLEPVRDTCRLIDIGPLFRALFLRLLDPPLRRPAATRGSRSPSCCPSDPASAEAASRAPSPNRECSGPGADGTRARARRCCRSSRTAARTPRAGCFRPSAAASASATTACCCTRSCSRRRRRPTRLLSSAVSCSDDSCVSLSNALAAIWSIETPFSTTLSDFFTWTPVRYDPGRARVIAAAVAERLRLMTGEARDDDQLIPERRERRERRREREVAAHALGQPVLVDDAVGMVDDAEAAHGLRRRLHLRGERRHHRVQQRQGHGRAHSAQHGAPRHGLLRDDHDRDLLI